VTPHTAVMLAASVPVQSLFFSHHSIDQLLLEMKAPEPGFAGVRILFSNVQLLLEFSRRIGASEQELSYLIRRRNYFAGRSFVEFARGVLSGRGACGSSPELYSSYLEMCVRVITLCEIYNPELAPRLLAAIMAG
jgi:hypothetical protein